MSLLLPDAILIVFFLILDRKMEVASCITYHAGKPLHKRDHVPCSLNIELPTLSADPEHTLMQISLLAPSHQSGLVNVREAPGH